MDDSHKGTNDALAEERDVEQVAMAQEEPAEKDHELVTVATSASERLPFSKVRCFALVATVAAAPYLTVRKTTRCTSKILNANAWM
jgi:hypothetical protein